jgi:hypothetical protein
MAQGGNAVVQTTSLLYVCATVLHFPFLRFLVAGPSFVLKACMQVFDRPFTVVSIFSCTFNSSMQAVEVAGLANTYGSLVQGADCCHVAADNESDKISVASRFSEKR